MPVRVHAIVSTHTPDRLAPCLRSLALQTSRPACVAVSSDTADPAILEIVRQGSTLLKPSPVVVVGRAFSGVARLNQVRNNALRALNGHMGDDDAVLVLDGDVVLAPNAVENHARLIGQGAGMVHAYRVNLDAAASAALIEAVSAANPGDVWTAEQFVTTESARALARRHARMTRHAVLRRLGLEWAGHKPKLLGAHHSVRVGLLRQVNGYDEAYEGYGFDDDDLARRLHATGARGAVAVRDILAFHLYHESRSGNGPTRTPGYERFRHEHVPERADLGWASPGPQASPTIDWMVTPAGDGRRSVSTSEQPPEPTPFPPDEPRHASAATPRSAP